MVKKLILTKNNILRTYNIKNIKDFNKRSIPISKVGNKLIYSQKKIRVPRKIIVTKRVRVVRKKKIPIPIKEVPKPLKRIRRQIAQNFKSSEPPYFVSVRAITINPEITQRGLVIALLQGKRNLEKETNINLSLMTSEHIGLAEQEIPITEDKELNDMKVHVEVFIANTKGGRNILRYYVF